MPEAERHTKDYRADGATRDEGNAAAGHGMDVVVVYVTVPALDVARDIGRALVGSALAACVNILPGMTAIYVWDGVLNEDAEVVLIVKTQRGLADAVIGAVRSRHPYENPAILVMPVVGGSAPYLHWVQTATRLP